MANATETTKKWASRMAGATTAYSEGVDRVQVAPGEQAAMAAPRWRDGVNRAASDGSYERGCRSVSLQDWKKSAKEKGAARLSTGAQAAVPKVQSFNNFWQPQMEQMSSNVQSMPKGTLADSLARSQASIQFAAALKGKFKQ